jgi:ketosteroid isomerase-like protein
MDGQELSDRQEIVDLITRYTRAVDTKTFDPIDVFTDDAVLDYSAAGGPAAPPKEALAWVAEMMQIFDRWQHTIGQVAIELSGDTATATAYFLNPMILKEETGEKLVEVGGYYHHELRRTPDGWRSTRMVDDVVWTRGF